MGFRTIETQGTDILLNGESIFLRGICIHEENPLRGGRAFNREDAEFLLSQAKDLNCNFVRLAHYPHNKYMAQVADSMGMLLWEEIPVYWTIQWENARTLENAKSQLTELIHRDINRASVIVWSVGNETPLSNARNTFMKSLVQHVRKMDDSRLISAAMEINYEKFERDTLIIDDPLGQHVDLLSYNEYIGWYVGLPQKCREITWEYAYEKPVCISELGAGALAGYHGDSLTRWSEEYQNFFYQEQIKMLEKIDQLRGTTPWILNDFRSPKRPLPYIQDGYNRKGLVSENGEKKQAYWTLREFYKYIENTFDPK
jgi:beta-glucuronidase